jgi:hypothetical protein
MAGHLIPSYLYMNGTSNLQAESVRQTLDRVHKSTGRSRLASAAIGLIALVIPVHTIAAQVGTSPNSQQPGAGAQVHTGVASGFDVDARLANLLAEHQFARIESELDHLPALQAQLYRGILASRSNDIKKSLDLLVPLTDQIDQSGRVIPEKLLRKTLGENYLRQGDLARSAAQYETLLSRIGDRLTTDELDEIELPAKLLPLAKNNPPMTVDACDPFEMRIERNGLGLIDVPVYVDGRQRSWLLDPTTQLNLIARSVARDAGLKISAEAVTIHTLRGKPMQIRMTLIPRFTIAGQLTLHNMTAFVFDDADYVFPLSGYHVQGVLGYAALAALSSITITDNNTAFVRPDKQIGTPNPNDHLKDGARFFLDGEQMIIALGAPTDESDRAFLKAAGDTDSRMYAVDMGGQQTYLTTRYYDEHSPDFEGEKKHMFSLFGAPQIPAVPAFTAETIPLTVGGVPVDVHFISVLTQPLGLAVRDDVYGLLGIDALDQLREYTFDFRTMRFSIRPER